jgi:hypothetical protein
MYDYKTRNSSFLHMRDTLFGLRVKNHSDHLMIHDDKLIGVDPYDPRLTFEMKARVVAECTRNVWYYIREVVRLESGYSYHQPFKLNLMNYALIWSFANKLPTVASSCRQQSRTVTLRVLKSYVLRFRPDNCTNQIINDKNELTIMDMMNQVKTPDYLDMHFMKISEREYENSAIQSVVKDIMSVTSYQIHPKSMLIIDDAAYNANGYNLLKYFEDEPNLNYWTVIATAACKPNTKISTYVHELITKSQRFVVSMLDMTSEQLKDICGGYIYVSFNPVELGMSREQFSEMAKMLTFSASVERSNLAGELLGEWDTEYKTYDECMTRYDELAKK